MSQITQTPPEIIEKEVTLDGTKNGIECIQPEERTPSSFFPVRQPNHDQAAGSSQEFRQWQCLRRYVSFRINFDLIPPRNVSLFPPYCITCSKKRATTYSVMITFFFSPFLNIVLFFLLFSSNQDAVNHIPSEASRTLFCLPDYNS